MKNTENRDGHYYTPLWKQGAGTDMHSAIVSGNDFAREASDSDWPVFFPVSSNSPRGLCDVNSVQLPSRF